MEIEKFHIRSVKGQAAGHNRSEIVPRRRRLPSFDPLSNTKESSLKIRTTATAANCANRCADLSVCAFDRK